MADLHRTHLSNILSFLHRKTNIDGFDTMRNAIQIKLHQLQNGEQTKTHRKVASMCPHCFTYWKEGKYSVKFKPKRKSKKDSQQNTSKRMVIKCLVCSHKEYQSYIRPTDEFMNRKQRKMKSFKKKINTSAALKRNKKSTATITSTNNMKINRKTSKQNKAKLKKNNLTILYDLL